MGVGSALEMDGRMAVGVVTVMTDVSVLDMNFLREDANADMASHDFGLHARTKTLLRDRKRRNVKSMPRGIL